MKNTDKNTFLELKNISKTFPGVKALEGINFDIKPGEVHSLVGENGAGKSTLIKIISGEYKPDEGSEIFVEGNKVEINGVRDSIRQGISVIYQDFSLFNNLSVAENIAINSIIEENKKILNWNEINKRAQRALNIVNADIKANELVENLSVAKKQIVAIAGAIAQDAKMIIMDEPTSALSKKEIENLYVIIQALKDKNIAIVFISHKMDELFTVSDRFTVLRDGKYVGTVNKDDVDSDQLISMMVGRKVNIIDYANTSEKKDVWLEVKNLSKKGNYKDISFKLYKGEVLGITGLVGAGRSELMHTIFGIEKPDSGEIHLYGKKTRIKNPSDAIKKKIAYIPESRQSQGLVLDKTLEKNIALPVLDKYKNILGIVDSRKQKNKVRELMSKLDVRPNNSDLLAMQLSGGNQQKVVIAKWIGTDANIIIFDEPTNGVDIGAKTEIHKIIRNIADQGNSVLVVSSELPEVMSVSDRILVMRRGRISGEFVNKNLTQEMIMEKAVVKR